jgi:hypothetical protein
MLPPTGALAGLMPVSDRAKPIIQSLKSNELWKFDGEWIAYDRLLRFPHSVRGSRELAFLPQGLAKN